MPQYRLRALTPGRRCVGFTPEGKKRFKTFTPEYCRNQFQRNSAMVAAGVPLPVSWEHRDDVQAGRMSRKDIENKRAKWTAGWVESFEAVKGGNGAFDAIVQIPDETEGKQAEKVRFCSPQIGPVTDGNGREWGRAFQHLALTPRPRQHPQPPIQRLSQGGLIRLALDPSKGTDMADETDDETEETEEPETESEETPQAPSDLKALIDALREKGMTIPDECKDLSDIVIAVKASPPCEPAAEPDPEPEPDEGTVREGSPPPMTLSLEKATKRAEAMSRKEILSRVSKLVSTGRITPDLGRKLKSEATKVRLSFGDEGDLETNPVIVKIEAYEALQKNTAWKPSADRTTRLSQVDEHDPPEPKPGAAKDGKTDAEFLKDFDATLSG